MFVMTLDVKQTHDNNPECPMHLARDPRGDWYCMDCGRVILWKQIKVQPVADDDPVTKLSEPSYNIDQREKQELRQRLRELTQQQPGPLRPELGFTINEIQPMAVSNARAVRHKTPAEAFNGAIEEFKDYFERHEHESNFGAPVEAFDREMSVNYCCDSSPDGNTSSASSLTGTTLATAMASCPEFVKGTEEGWKAIEQGRYTSLTALRQRLDRPLWFKR